jgi:hypothetical protein
MKKWLVFGFLLALIVVGNDMFAQGCSQCKMLSEQGSELSEGSFGTNINWGILYLMIIPYLLIMHDSNWYMKVRIQGILHYTLFALKKQ